MNNIGKEGSENDISPTEIIRQASVPDKDQIVREMRRGGKSGPEGDDKDVAGSIDRADTPEGREDTKRAAKQGGIKK
jgi:hypothetical protein